MPADLPSLAQGLAVALAAGLVVGLERGWRDRDLEDGGRVAGLRTFALVGLFGGVLASLPQAPVAIAAGIVALGGLLCVSYGRTADASRSLSITTAVAALATLGLGALAASGAPVLAMGAAVIVAVVLGLKEVTHGWLRAIEPAELNALLQLGVVSAVILPLLPDERMGPYAALNPYSLWLAVIVVASLSLAGHAMTRARGAAQGLLWTGLLGGLASSTPATLTLARFARDDAAAVPAGAAAAVAASGVMFLRMALVVSVLQPGSSLGLAVLLSLLAIATFAAAAYAWRRSSGHPPGRAARPPRLFDLPAAIGFAAVLAVVTVASRAALQQFGDEGFFAVSFLSGLADVDAATISTAQLAAQGALRPGPAAVAVLLAAGANLLLKAAVAWVVGGAAFGRRVVLGYAAAVAGAAVPVGISFMLR